MLRHILTATSVTAIGIGLCAPAANAQPAPYNYTTYTISPTSMSWITCGATAESEGCFGLGHLGPFGRVCAVLEGALDTNGGISRQPVYVMDSNAGSGTSVALNVYRKTVVTTKSNITTTFKLIRALSLSLVGGSNTTCQAAANAAFVAAATSSSTNVALIDKTTLKVENYGGFSPPENVSSITVDAAGYLALNFTSGYYLLGPDGQELGDGGGNAIVIPPDNAYIP